LTHESTGEAVGLWGNLRLWPPQRLFTGRDRSLSHGVGGSDHDPSSPSADVGMI